jgi:hypothetical protein
MLTRKRTARHKTEPSLAESNPDLKIRSLLDDPALRQAMGLESEAAVVAASKARPMPRRRFDRRRLLESATL